jgi:hypothetical protein
MPSKACISIQDGVLKMRKSTKKTIMALVIVLLFGMSSIAYVVLSISNPARPEEGFKPLEKYVIDYELNRITENEYINRGFTIFRFYYSDKTDASLVSYVDQLPNILKTDSNQIQLIVQKLPSNNTYADIVNYYVQEELENLTEESIFDSLCANLLSSPLECSLKTLNITD